MKRNSKSILLLIVLMFLIIGVGTYAWLSYRSNDTAMVFTVGDIERLRITLKPYQINAVMSPLDSYEDEDVIYTSVEAINNDSDTNNMKLYYLINSIDSELVSNDFKYTILRSTDGENYTFLSDGDFSEITNNTLIVLEEDIPANTTYAYKIYTWLKNNEENQLQIQGAKFDGELRAEIVID